MPYNILSEYLSKKYYSKCNNIFNNIERIYKNNVNNQHYIKEGMFVCKVDEEIKHRKKLGLVQINKKYEECLDWIKKSNYNRFIIEPMQIIKKELYLMIRFNNDYDELYFSENGGIDFNNLDTCEVVKLDPLQENQIINLDQPINVLNTIHMLYKFYRKYNLIFMEVNPLVILENDKCIPLDFAVKYDSTSLYLLDELEREEILSEIKNNNYKNEIEKKIEKLDSKTGASLKFNVLNKNGSIWTLIAGGGASVIYTDAIINFGLKDELANYGEYSGNPSTNSVYQYSKLIFDFMLNSNTKKKITLIIGGGISNFTYVDKTFEGIIKSINELGDKLSKKDIKIYVRRGGLNYKIGLENIKKCCFQHGIDCITYGPETHITNFLSKIFPKRINKKKEKIKELPEDILKIISNKQLCILNSNKFYDENSKIIILNYQINVVQRILDYDYMCKKKFPSVVGIVHPPKAGSSFSIFWGNKEILLPVFDNINQACEYDKNINVAINYNSFRSSFRTSMEVINHKNINVLAIVAEGIPESQTRILNLIATKKNKTILGPSTVGSIMVGKLRIGNTCGSIENIKSLQLYSPGSVSVVTRSGGLLNEMCNIIHKTTDGVCEAVSIGGDRYPGSSFIDHIFRFEKDPNVKLICMLGEVGGILELFVAEAVKSKLIKKPVISWVMGTSASELSEDIQFGHAGSSATNEFETANYKNIYMHNCGIIVPSCFEEMENVIKIKAQQLNLVKKKDSNYNKIPQDFDTLYKNGLIRKKSDFFSGISNETLDELEYNHKPISNIISNKYCIGRTIGNLLFKKDLPEYLCKFLELVMSILSDHGIAVSSSHNTAVCTRSGQNISAAVASGLLCIHEKHGGALQDAAESFYNAKYKNNLSPEEFVKYMKKKGKYIPGIGHAYKNSTTNIDKRIKILSEYINKFFENYDLVKYSRNVEKITLQKKENLILNVDGLVACAIVSAFLFHYGIKETEDMINLKGLNSIFIISRTIGLCGTFIDQNRLNQGLYRHNLNSITYL